MPIGWQGMVGLRTREGEAEDLNSSTETGRSRESARLNAQRNCRERIVQGAKELSFIQPVVETQLIQHRDAGQGNENRHAILGTFLRRLARQGAGILVRLSRV